MSYQKNIYPKQKYYSLKCSVASFLATYVSGVLHPLDVIRTRFQSHDGKIQQSENIVPHYSNIRQAIKIIYHQQGFGGLYKGFYVSILSQALATSFFFWLYEKQKLKYQNLGYSTMSAVTIASSQASFLGTIITQPFWIIKTRLVLQSKDNSKQFKKAKEKILELYRTDGSKGFFKGLSLSLMLSVTGLLQMFSYQGSKQLYTKFKIPQSRFQQKNFICGIISKIASVFVTFPLTTIRTRIQQDQYFGQKYKQKGKYNSIKDIINRLMRQQGVRGLYKGLSPQLIRGIPYKGLYFYSYQFFKKIMLNSSNNSLKSE